MASDWTGVKILSKLYLTNREGSSYLQTGCTEGIAWYDLSCGNINFRFDICSILLVKKLKLRGDWRMRPELKSEYQNKGKRETLVNNIIINTETWPGFTLFIYLIFYFMPSTFVLVMF